MWVRGVEIHVLDFGEERAYMEQGCGLWALEWVRSR